MSTIRIISFGYVLSAFLFADALGSELIVIRNGGRTELALQGRLPFRTTEAQVSDARLVTGLDSRAKVDYVPPAAGEYLDTETRRWTNRPHEHAGFVALSKKLAIEYDS